jgi:hypothetical protein
MFKKKYPGLSFAENFLGGHITIGKTTIYGENAMHWGVNIYTKRWGYICFRLPFPCHGYWWPLYFYLSPNATPWGATFYIGAERGNSKLAKKRKKKFGHNFCTDTNRKELQKINGTWMEERDNE